MKKYFWTILFAVIPLMFHSEDAYAIDQLSFRDTIRTGYKRVQFLTAIDLAPQTFYYDDYTDDGAGCVTIKGLRFNDSMKRTLKCDVVDQDPGLRKRLKRMYNAVRPFNAIGNLEVRYNIMDIGIAVEYHISEIRIWGRKASLKEVKDIEKSNSAPK